MMLTHRKLSITALVVILLAVTGWCAQARAAVAEHGGDVLRVVILTRNPEDKTVAAMVKVFKGCGCRVHVRSTVEAWKNEGAQNNLIALVRQAQLLILGMKCEESSEWLVSNMNACQELLDFFRNGGTALFRWGWPYVKGWKNFFRKHDIWFASLERIKPYFQNRIAFETETYVPNVNCGHMLLRYPHRLSGFFGVQNFGLDFPKTKTDFRLVVSSKNPCAVGVSLQENVLGRGSVLFSPLYYFMDVGGKTLKLPGEPMAHHSLSFLENLVHYARIRIDTALAARVEKAINRARGTPAQEAVNQLLDKTGRRALRCLCGKEECSAPLLAGFRKRVRELLYQLGQGPAWPSPAKAIVPRITAVLKIDGNLNEPAWQKALTFQGSFRFNQREHQDTPGMVWRMLWDDKYLYFAFDCADRDILCSDTRRQGVLRSHDCVTVFILPEWRTGLYWEVVISPAGAVFTALHVKDFTRNHHVTRTGEMVKGLLCRTRVHGTPNSSEDEDAGYAVELAVPFRELPGYMRGNKPRCGDGLHLMLTRFDRNTGREIGRYAVKPLLSCGHNVWNYIPIVLGQ